MNPTTLSDWLAHCERLHPVTIDMGLDRVQRVAQRMGLVMNCPVITVAGTNGKGSTCAMLEAVYGEAGFRTGVYTSPHLVHFEERCRVAGELVAADALLPAFAEVEAARLGQGASGTMMAARSACPTLNSRRWPSCARLSQSQLDVAILEVGLGGRLDAVNIIDTDCAVITSIALDHTALLGTDREAIGYEKAGIMRTGRPVIVSDPVPPQSVLDRAHGSGRRPVAPGQGLSFRGRPAAMGLGHAPVAWRAALCRAGLSGVARRESAGERLGRAGRARSLAARACRSRRRPCATGWPWWSCPGGSRSCPATPSLVLDVAHNPHSVAALTENLDAMGFFPTTHAVFGAMADKDLPAMLERIAPLIDRWYVTDLPLERASTAEALADQLDGTPGHGAQGACRGWPGAMPRPWRPCRAAVAAADPADRIVVFGSFHHRGWRFAGWRAPSVCETRLCLTPRSRPFTMACSAHSPAL